MVWRIAGSVRSDQRVAVAGDCTVYRDSIVSMNRVSPQSPAVVRQCRRCDISTLPGLFKWHVGPWLVRQIEWSRGVHGDPAVRSMRDLTAGLPCGIAMSGVPGVPACQACRRARLVQQMLGPLGLLANTSV